jgi:hypothetical protein
MIRCFWGFVVAMILSGCATHPLPEDVTRRSTLAIVKAIRCEAVRATQDPRHVPEWVYDGGANGGAIGLVFDFDITENNTAGLNLGLTKIFPSGMFTMNVPPNSALMREAHRTFTIVDTFAELKKAEADCSQEAIQSNFPYPIAGEVGLTEVIDTAIGIDQLGKAQPITTLPGAPGGQAAVFSDDLTYTTTIDTGLVNPSATFSPVPGVLRLASVSGSFEANRKDVHQLTVAIALPDPPKSTSQGRMRVAARSVPVQQTILGSRGIPSKVLIHGTSNSQIRVLWELDRRRLLGEEDRLINALGTTPH